MNGSPGTKRQTLIRSFDFFPKIESEYKIRSLSSTIISVVCVVILLYLFIGELMTHLSVNEHWHVGVHIQNNISERLAYYSSSDVNSKIDVHLDMSMPGLKCDMFGLDVLDSGGDLQLEYTDTVKKVPEGNGCRMICDLRVKRIGGEFHIAFGREAAAPHHHGHDPNTHAEGIEIGHIHRFTWADLKTFNASHVIHELRFGPKVPEVAGTMKGPLDGESHIILEKNGRFQYFVRIIPVLYRTPRTEVKSNQYSVTTRFLPVDTTAKTFYQPGVFFKYGVEPYVVTHLEESRSFLHFMVRCCALIGGIFVVFGWMSSMLYHLGRARVAPSPASSPQIPSHGMPPASPFTGRFSRWNQ